MKVIKNTEFVEGTRKHKNEVILIGRILINSLIERIHHHDDSKLSSAERDCFEEVNKEFKDKDIEYGSKEYDEKLKKLKPALDHHYKENRHHPEHFEEPFGKNGMDLLDLFEMYCDWYSACHRGDGNILHSIEINQKRFGFSDDIKNILINTVNNYKVPDYVFDDKL